MEPGTLRRPNATRCLAVFTGTLYVDASALSDMVRLSGNMAISGCFLDESDSMRYG